MPVIALTGRLAIRGRRSKMSSLSVSVRLALGFVCLLVAVAVFGRWFAPYSPTRNFVGPSAASPSWDHPFGTDEFGRDVFSRAMAGTQISLTVAVLATLAALVAGGVMGGVVVTAPRLVRESVMRLLDLIVTFPGIILAVALASVLGPSMTTTIIVIAILYTPAMARVVRANVLSEYAKDYVAAEQTLGASRWRILVKHVARNIAGPVGVFAVVLSAEAILIEAALTFLGLGIQPPEASWGTIVKDGLTLVNSGGWWVGTFGGVMIFLTVLAFMVVADALANSVGMPGRHRGRQVKASTIGARERLEPGNSLLGGSYDVPSAPVATVPGVVGSSTGATSDDGVTGATDGHLGDTTTNHYRGDALLAIQDLCIRFPATHGRTDIVSNVSFDVHADEIVGLVGESGSGKTITGLAIMGLLPQSAVVSGAIWFQGVNLLDMPPRQRRRLLGRQIAMVYQDALSSLNPSMTIRAQLHQLCRRGGKHSPAELLEMVQLSPDAVLRAYPHQLSGGQRQRVLIALALSRDPQLLIADEPTTALDVTIQAQIVDLIRTIREDRKIAVLLISHDLGLVADLADRVDVMYAGQMAESGPTDALLQHPQHPYTAGLVNSIVSVELGRRPLDQIPGSVPTPVEWVSGCRFFGRCPNQRQRCADVPPSLTRGTDKRSYACYHPIQFVAPRVSHSTEEAKA